MVSGTSNAVVNTKSMPFNPVDDEGHLGLKKDDNIGFTGKVDKDFLRGKPFDATYVVRYLNTRKN